MSLSPRRRPPHRPAATTAPATAGAVSIPRGAVVPDIGSRYDAAGWLLSASCNSLAISSAVASTVRFTTLSAFSRA